MIIYFTNVLLEKLASAVFSIVLFLLLFSAPPLMADNSPNNGAYYDIKQDNIYYELKKADSYTRYDRYVVVDADYTDRLVIADYIEGLPVDYVYNMSGRTDIEYLSIGSRVRNADFRFCPYLSEVDLSRIEVVNANIDISGTDVRRLEIPAIKVTARNCGNLEEIIFTGNGSGSFTDCKKLSTVTMHEDMTVCPFFNGCSELQSIHIPAGVKTIQNYAFDGCRNLASATIADGSLLTAIYDFAFRGTGLRHFDCPDGVQIIAAYAFANTPIEEFRLPASITKQSAVPGIIFRDCHALARIDYPDLQTLLALSPKFTVEDSHYNKYEKCVELLVGGAILTELVIPLSAPDTDFTRTTGLRTVTIDNATSRKSHSFAIIPTLEDVSVGAGEIEIYCKGCTNLRTVNVSPKNKATRLYYITNAFSGCSSLESISFPKVEELSYDCFKGCTSLRKVDFPNVKSIGQSCFEGCTSLTDVNLPLVETVDWRCFFGCTALETIALPEVTEIGDSNGSVFEGCSSLVNVDCPKAKVIGEGSFKGCTNLSNFNFEQLTDIMHEAFMGTGFVEVTIPLTCNVHSNAFSSCHKLKQLSMPVMGWSNCVKDLPVAENLLFYPNPEAGLEIYNCFIENEGNIRVNGSISGLAINNVPGLNRLSVMGVVTKDFLLQINDVPKEFEVRTVEEYLAWKFRNNGFTPGFQADGPDLIDFYVSGQLVKDLLIPPGSKVQDYAFNKFNIESVTIGGFKTDSPTTINYRSFYNCKNLKKLNVYGNLTIIGSDAFMSTGLISVDLPSTVTAMGRCSFGYCKDLRHISFPQSLTVFPDATVFGCEKLESLIIPEGVTMCGYQVASGTTNKELKTISLPGTIEALSRAYLPSFENFTHDLEFLSWSYVAPAANIDNFTGFTVHVPKGAGNNYKNKAAWTNAVIIEDLLVGNNVKVEGTDVVVYVPKQIGVSERAAVSSYIVDCYDASVTDPTEPDYTFEFDAEGNELSAKSRSATDEQWQELRIPGLPSNTSFVLDIKGRTATNDLIYSHSQEVITGTVDVEDSLINNDIVLKANTLFVPVKYAGEMLGIYSTGGSLMLSKTIGECGSEIVLELECGVYVLQCANTTLKFKL